MQDENNLYGNEALGTADWIECDECTAMHCVRIDDMIWQAEQSLRRGELKSIFRHK